MQRHEYDVIKIDISGGFFSAGGVVDVDRLKAELNSRGKEGWELINSFDTNMHEGKSRNLVLIFKREV